MWFSITSRLAACKERGRARALCPYGRFCRQGHRSLVDASPDNIERIKRALAVLPDNAVREVRSDEMERYDVIRVADEVVVDLISKACGVTWKEAARDSEVLELDGVEIPIAGIATLIKNQADGPPARRCRSRVSGTLAPQVSPVAKTVAGRQGPLSNCDPRDCRLKRATAANCSPRDRSSATSFPLLTRRRGETRARCSKPELASARQLARRSGCRAVRWEFLLVRASIEPLSTRWHRRM